MLDLSAIVEIYNSLFETWRFEVNSHWQRSSYFAAFETVAVAACWTVTTSTSGHNWAGPVLALLGIALTIVWFVSNNKTHEYAVFWLNAAGVVERKIQERSGEHGIDFARQVRKRPRTNLVYIKHPFLVQAPPVIFFVAWGILLAFGISVTVLKSGAGMHHSNVDFTALGAWITNLANPIITAVAGLVGVALGGGIAMWSQKREQRHALLRAKLTNFYSPLLGIRKQILAKSEVREKINSIARAKWPTLFMGVDDPEMKKKIEEDRWPAFEKLIEYSDQQLREELVPLYRKMLELFTDNMQFAEDSTLTHYGVLVELTELWNRALQNPIPAEVASSLDFGEARLYPFYEDLEQQFRKLRDQLD